jgi:hypothetical protein
MEKKRNLWIIPTDKPSRLILQGSELVLSKYKEVNEGFSEFNQHIYITSDEEIKVGDYFIESLGLPDSYLVHKLSKEWKDNCEEERLLGVSVTGQWDSKLSRDPEMLKKLRLEAIRVNKI